MENSEIFVSVATINRLSLLALYLSVVLVVNWRLFPHFAPAAEWLATIVLVAQVVVIVTTLEIQPSSYFERWQWYLGQERSIPSTVASTQMALAGIFAWGSAYYARGQSAKLRLYLLAAGLFFVFFALDDYFSWRLFLPYWQPIYLTVAALLVAATIVMTLRATQPARKWLICLVTGFALIALGSLVFDKLPNVCDEWGLLRLDGCIRFKSFHDEIHELAGSWLALVAFLGMLSETAPLSSRRAQAALFAAPLLWIVMLHHFSPIARFEIESPAEPSAIRYESDVFVHGQLIEQLEGAVHVRLHAATWWRNYLDLGYSIHLVDQVSGESVASNDVDWCCQQGLPSYIPVYEQRTTVNMPVAAATNRAYWVVLSIWRRDDGEFVSQKVLVSDQELLNAGAVILDELVLPAPPPDETAAPLAVFNETISLAPVELPMKARAGQALPIAFTWRADADGDDEYVQFLHLGHEDSGEWWVYDQQPLGARLPTRLWYAGLADSETWLAPLPADLAPGRYHVFTGLYRASDQERVPVTDAAGDAFVDARVPLGSLIIE